MLYSLSAFSTSAYAFIIISGVSTTKKTLVKAVAPIVSCALPIRRNKTSAGINRRKILKKAVNSLKERKDSLSLHSQNQGLLAEWLGTGLQNRLQQFESARDLELESVKQFNHWMALFFLCDPLSHT